MLVLLYLALAPRFMPKIAHPLAILGLDALTMLFWFAGFIALAVFHHDLEIDIEFDGWFATRGCSDLFDICPTVEAAVVFGAFEWYVLQFPGVSSCRCGGYGRVVKGTQSAIADMNGTHRALFVVTTTFAILGLLRGRSSKGTTMSEPTMTA